MAINLYESLMTKNANLVRFTDKYPAFAKLFYKIVMHVEQVCKEKGRGTANGIEFEATASPDGRVIAIKIKGI